VNTEPKTGTTRTSSARAAALDYLLGGEE
jgi:hypothetical protein